MANVTDREARRRMSVDARKQEIVYAAAVLFDEAGFASVSMDDIADRVGIAKPTVYYYFRSKTDLLEEIFNNVYENLNNALDDPARETLSPSSQLFEVMADIILLNETLPGHPRVYYHHQADLTDTARADIEQKRSDYERRVTDIMLRAIEAGEIQVSDVHLTVVQIFGISSYSYQWLYRIEGRTIREIAEILWTNLFDGIKRR